MHWLIKVSGRVISVAVLLLIVGLVFLDYKVYDISSIIFNLQQRFSGSFGDKFIVVVCTTLICTMVARYFNLQLGSGVVSFSPGLFIQKFSRKYLLTPTGLTDAAGLLALSSPSREVNRQQLVLMTYLVALFLRFCGSENETRQRKLRLRSRFWEYLIYMWLSRCHLLLNVWVLLPAAIYVSLARSNEVFRIWRNREKPDRADHEQADHMFRRVDDMLLQQQLPQLSWPSGTTHSFQDNRRAILGLTLGTFRHMKHSDKMYTFLWIEGTGLLISLAYYTIIYLLVNHQAKLEALEVLFCSAIILLYLSMQCVPGLLARIDVAIELVTNKDDVKTMASKIIPRVWLSDLQEFLHVLTEGTPLEDHEGMFGYWLSILEGYELMCYVVVSSLARAVARACLICCAAPFKLIMISVHDDWSQWVKDSWSKKAAPSLIYAAVKLSAPDISNVNRIIVQAEGALDARKQCSICIEITDVKIKVDEFKKNIGYNHHQQYSLGAFDRALCELAFASLEEVNGNSSIETGLRNLLLLIKLYHESMFEWSNDIKVVRDLLKAELDQFNLIQYENGYKGNTALARHCGCITELDWKLMKAQFIVSLLLQAHEQPRQGERLISFTALMVWMEMRRDQLQAKVDIVTNSWTSTDPVKDEYIGAGEESIIVRIHDSSGHTEVS